MHTQQYSQNLLTRDKSFEKKKTLVANQHLHTPTHLEQDGKARQGLMPHLAKHTLELDPTSTSSATITVRHFALRSRHQQPLPPNSRGPPLLPSSPSSSWLPAPPPSLLGTLGAHPETALAATRDGRLVIARLHTRIVGTRLPAASTATTSLTPGLPAPPPPLSLRSPVLWSRHAVHGSGLASRRLGDGDGGLHLEGRRLAVAGETSGHAGLEGGEEGGEGAGGKGGEVGQDGVEEAES